MTLSCLHYQMFWSSKPCSVEGFHTKRFPRHHVHTWTTVSFYATKQRDSPQKIYKQFSRKNLNEISDPMQKFQTKQNCKTLSEAALKVIAP